MNIGSVIVLVTALSLSAGCSVKPASHFADHAIRINGDGNIVPVIEEPQSSTSGLLSSTNQPAFASEAVADYQKQIRQIFKGAEAANQNLLIFVHGGLVSFDDSTKRTNELVKRYETDANSLLDGYYPITINWDSSLPNAYLEHLAFVRQGEKWSGTPWGQLGIVTAPLYLLADIGRSLFRAPINVLYNAAHNIGAIPAIRNAWSPPAVNADLLYKGILRQKSSSVSEGKPRNIDAQTVYKVPWNIVTFPVQALVAPLVDGLGTPAWANMERRIKNIDNKPEEFDIKKDPLRVDDALKGLPPSVMDEFASQLTAFAHKHPEIKITLVAHSMGAFVVNDLLPRTPDVKYANIVYMAGADSIRNSFNSVLYYLSLPKHEETQFYILTLHPQAEIEEWHALGIAPRGSLLVWIDDFFSSPSAFLDRTVGRWENIVQAFGEIDDSLRTRVHIKAFDQTSNIRDHGDFGSACFWQHEFWEPGPEDGQDPWDKPSYDGKLGDSACNRRQ